MIKYYPTWKRIIDLTLSTLGICFLSPLIISISLMQFMFYGHKVFYLQTRAGLFKDEFKIIKFRTMRDKYDNAGKLLPDYLRVTHWGKMLRFASLDELPNLVNVLKGHMSIVGPRPVPVNFLELMTKEQLNRFKIRPGITGYAQINGRNNLSWPNKIILDIWYINNLSFLLDLKIILKSFFKIFGYNNSKELGQNSIDTFVPNFKD